MTFEEFLISRHKKEDGTYPYGYDLSRPREFMTLGTLPSLLEIIWEVAYRQGYLARADKEE